MLIFSCPAQMLRGQNKSDGSIHSIVTSKIRGVDEHKHREEESTTYFFIYLRE